MKMLNGENLGTLLREIRVERDLKQADVSGAIGLTVPTVSKIENGRRDTPTKTLVKWSDACGYVVTLVPLGLPPGEMPTSDGQVDADLAAIVRDVLESWSLLSDVERGMIRAQVEFGRVRAEERRGKNE